MNTLHILSESNFLLAILNVILFLANYPRIPDWHSSVLFYTGVRSKVGNVSDCRSVPYFHGDLLCYNLYGYSPPYACCQLHAKECPRVMVNRLGKLAQEKSVVR